MTKNHAPGKDSQKRRGLDPPLISSDSESRFLHFEQNVLAEYAQKAIPNTLDLFFRITTTRGLAGTFDPDLSSRIGNGIRAAQMLDNCNKASTRDSSLGPLESILDLSTPFRYPDWTNHDMENRDINMDYDEISKVPQWDVRGIEMDVVESPQVSPFDDNSYIPFSFPVQVSQEIDPLSAMSQEIVGRLRDSIAHRPQNSYIKLRWSPEVEKECIEFFSPVNLHRFVDLYWVTWYIHWPVIHKSTFQASEAPCTLVAAMVLIGASYSTIPQDRAFARIYCDGVEEIVFGDEYFGDSAVYSVLNAACLERRLRSLQAAHAMCLYQAWEGHETGKKRARRHRFGQVVAMACELGFAHASHGNLASLTECNFNWKEFILKEELIRTMNYMAVLDFGFIVMNNMPPRVFVSELQADLACPEACFQATSASECFSYLKVWLSHPLASAGQISFLDAVEQLSRENMSWDKLQAFTHLGYLNLGFLAVGKTIVFCVFESTHTSFLSAMHSIIFQIRSSFCWQMQTIYTMRNWLRNWSIVWNLQGLCQTAEAFGTPLPPQEIPDNLADRWRNAGFMKDANQFWFLAKILLDNLESNRHLSPFVKKTHDYDETGMNHLKSLLESYRKQ
ncbi:hypothetical protein AYL99_10566 [Fonsecaea erecta]|uniref:Xylanolytic transcriptional activator regulatory domain-containing protein n=1 Tax=Fonsecaea erecta TaxID=1367422 RepID=A0A178Z8U9_9EURO|nr:hypothetical protein AYL99_10566 [Fonsecaea erecta]OAP55593.1 hypothetical protein AYL99_10566 [Fonsecaea erecta]